MPPKKGSPVAKASPGTASKAGKADPKKAAEQAALKEQHEEQRVEVGSDEERARAEILSAEQISRKELKAHWKGETARFLLHLDTTIRTLTNKVAEVTKTTGLQVVKLEDELSRLAMSKEVIVQENILLKKEASELKADDAGRQMIAQLTSRLKQMEAERAAKGKEHEEAVVELNRRLAKQLSENRLMRIQHKDAEQQWALRVQRLEQSVTAAVDALTAAAEPQSTARVAVFQTAIEASKKEYLDALRKARHSLSFTSDLVDLKSMHSNLPRRIQARLEGLSTEELRLLIDALSFEESVLAYLEAKWPPEEAEAGK
eukprot:RCo049640